MGNASVTEGSRPARGGRGLPAPPRAGRRDRRREGEGRRLHPAPAAARRRPARVAGGGGPRPGQGDPGAGGRLIADGVELVVMESTSDYWRIWFYLLESAGLAVQLVNSSHARQLAGRPKTDRLDAQWIARLAEMGLLRPVVRAAAGDPGAARPDPHPAAAGPRPHPGVAAAGEAPGGRPGQAVIGGLVAGPDEDRPRHPGGPRRRRARPEGPAPRWPPRMSRAAAPPSSGPWRACALGGHHPMLIRAHLDHITLLDRAVAMIEDEIEAALDAIPGARGITADGVPSPDPGPGAAALPAAERLAEIPGVSPELARAIIAETGLDMTRFPTAARLVSWAGLAPVARQSGPRSRKPGKGHGDAYLKGYCTQAATGAARTATFLGERLRRLSRRLGGSRARCAVARSILVIIWHLLANPEARFADLGPDWHDAHADRDRKIQAHLRQLRALGLDVTLTPAA